MILRFLPLIGLVVLCAAPLMKAHERFITRKGAALFDGTTPFRFVSVNLPEATSVRTDWDLKQGRRFRLPELVELDWMAESSAQANFKVIRTWMFPDTRTDGWPADLSYFTGNPDGVTVTLNEEAFRRFDYLIKRCAEVGVRLQVPFVYLYYGRVPLWQTPEGLPHPQFLDLVAQVVGRTNTYTGIRYADDPTIYAWESANEPKPPSSWVAALAAHVKRLAPRQLFVDGRWGTEDVYDSYCLPDSPLLRDPNIDIVSVHTYGGPLKREGWDWDRTLGETARILATGDKALDLGEIGPEVGGAELAHLLDLTIKHNLVSAMYWSSKGASAKGGYVHWSGRAYDDIAWPGFVDPALPGVSGEKEDRIDLLVDAAYRIEGRVRPSILPAPSRATMLSVRDPGHIAWVPGAGEQTADIERAVAATGEFTVIARDFPTHRVSTYAAFHDTDAVPGQTYLYRVRSKNSGGFASEPSAASNPVLAQHRWLIDDFWDVSRMSAHSPGVRIEAHYRLFGFHDDLAVVRTTEAEAQIGYALAGTANRITLISNNDTSSISFWASRDGQEFVRVPAGRKLFLPLHQVYAKHPRVLYESDDLTRLDYRFVQVRFGLNDVLTRIEIAHGGTSAPESLYGPVVTLAP